MDCPHCSAENLIGATVCASCGKSMIQRPRFLAPGAPAAVPEPPPRTAEARPAKSSPSGEKEGRSGRTSHLGEAPQALWGAGPAETKTAHAAPASASEALEQAICRICKATFDRAADQTESSPMCQGCKVLSEQNLGANLGENDVQMHPATADDVDVAKILLGGDPRPRIIGARRTGIRMGPVAAAAGLVLCLVTLGVMKVTSRKEDRAAKLLGEVKAESAQIVVAPEESRVLKWDSTLRLKVQRDEVRASFGGLSRVLDMMQTTTQLCEATFVREDEQGPVFDVAAECRVTEQTGKIGAEDAREAEVYPFRGHRSQLRVRAPAGRPTALMDGGDVRPGRDMPFLFGVGDAGLGARTLTVGDKWTRELRLSALSDSQGRLFELRLPVNLAYMGRAMKSGVPCAAIRLNATPPQNVPPPLDEAYNRREGEFAGAIFFELSTGLIVEATIDFDVRFWRDAGRIEDDLRSSGRYEIKRR